ncbi:MAG: bacteriohopanetetrol glucosamine biosynthesis glycosyltransferase HpnI [Acidobacteriota bacterium]|nr:bacteriohopanetetrol glucosamine biosynthesis glycosyltransferase HpnI [Acidobacteriota bacterium]
MALAVTLFFLLLTLSGLAYLLLALLGVRQFRKDWARPHPPQPLTPGVSILKPVKGAEPGMYPGFVSHCRQQYGSPFELLFGVSSQDDPAVPFVQRLQAEFPHLTIRLIVCPQQLGTSGKVSNLVQLLQQAQYQHILINDSDIAVGPHYLTRILAPFADPRVGMVTAPYLGRALADASGHIPVWTRLEALGISTDFQAGVLTARRLEGGIRFGLGSTLAVTRASLAAIGGLQALLESLADDYEMGARIAAAGYRVELANEVVETTVPAYTLRGFWEHQLRWARSTRDSRRWGYVGLGITYALPWAAMTVIASGFAMWSFSLLSVVLLARVAVALNTGVGILRDGQVLRDLWLLPLRDCAALAVWAWSFAGDTVVWRGERFRLKNGRMVRL